jgi:hypothetical protein
MNPSSIRMAQSKAGIRSGARKLIPSGKRTKRRSKIGGAI